MRIEKTIALVQRADVLDRSRGEESDHEAADAVMLPMPPRMAAVKARKPAW